MGCGKSFSGVEKNIIRGGMMMKKNQLLAGAVLLALTGWSGAAAADQVYTLNPVVVTAQRMETTEIETPATETVVTAKKIEEAGYKNAFDIIESQVGLTSTGYGDGGQDFGFSSGRTVIRGYDRGTLVMVDGIPMNLKNYNSLDGIPVEMIEKVEIIKGAAGTLYGSEAMGGVVNIITKKPGQAKQGISLKGTVGNYYKDFGVTYAGDRLLVSLSKEYSDDYTRANDFPHGSSIDWWIGKGQKNRAAVAGKLTDELSFNFMFQDGTITRGGIKTGRRPVKYDYTYQDRRITTGLYYQGKDNGVKATLGYNYRQADGWDHVKNARISASADLESYIVDVQKEWKLGERDTLITGYSFKREDYTSLVKSSNKAHRTNNALYLSWDHAFNDRFSTTVGLRGEMIDDPFDDQRIINPQFQTLYKINDTTSWYINVGRAFQMPTVDAYFSNKVAAGGLKPEKGWTYETGVKKLIGDKSSLKFAVYHMDFDNKLGWSDKDPLTGLQHAINKGEFRNTGVEAEFARTVNAHWDYSLGLGYGNPEIRDPSKKNSKWEQDAGRIDIAAALTYRADKVRSTMTFKYLGDRECYSIYGDVPSRIRLTWNTIYDITPRDTVSLTLNNLLDHKNYANRYGNLELPLNWRLSYSHRF